MGYLFISYSRKQVYFAEAIALQLERAGFETWFDLQKLGPGVDWKSALKDGFDNCEKLVFVASKAALASPYVQVEWETALRNGRQVIVVLAEAVQLPDSLRACPVYDARTHFDRTLGHLIGYLRGEAPARHDLIPKPGKFPLPLKMPWHIWLTIFVMMLPTFTIWITTLFYPRDGYNNLLLIGFGIGLVLLLSKGVPLFRFWKHIIHFHELKSERWNLLGTQAVTSLVCGALLYFTDRDLPQLVGFVILAFPLLTLTWAFHLLTRSADILRWFPSGNADQDVRESIYGEALTDITESAHPEKEAVVPSGGVTFSVHCHPADQTLSDVIASTFQKEGCIPARETEANTHLIIITNRTSKQWLNERSQTLSGRVIPILGTNIEVSSEIQPILQKQIVDFRFGRLKTIQSLAKRLMQEDSMETAYGIQVSPRGFSDFNAMPGTMWVPWLFFGMAASIPIFIGLKQLDPLGVGFVVLGLVVWFLFDMLMMRKIALPGFLHKLTNKRFTFFASPAPSVKDPVGMDARSKHRLLRWGFLVLMVYMLASNFDSSGSDPSVDTDEAWEWQINGTPFKKVGETIYIVIEGTAVPFSVNGTPVMTREP